MIKRIVLIVVISLLIFGYFELVKYPRTPEEDKSWVTSK